jgi:hypothetical protein
MTYYDGANLATVTKYNMIDEGPCGYGTLRTTGIRIWHQVSHRACAEVSSFLEVSHTHAQRSQHVQNFTFQIVKCCSILSATPSLLVLSGACENAHAEFESTLQRFRVGWQDRKVHGSTGRAVRVSGRFASGFRTKFHFAEVTLLSRHN